ncbi:hypothetical protein CRG98_014003 [Punica granatum]|uniref:Uncharacterized protein n=1 Tax=Punica granatum TaxID=22663 RepID=A0A2I0KBN1_PUNGR|nr:hypothetical protein CRG98_014003 [Punica granatum]
MQREIGVSHATSLGAVGPDDGPPPLRFPPSSLSLLNFEERREITRALTVAGDFVGVVRANDGAPTTLISPLYLTIRNEEERGGFQARPLATWCGRW